MADRILRLDRRELLAGLGATALPRRLPSIAAAQARSPLALQAKAGFIALRPGAPDTPIWTLGDAAPRPFQVSSAARRLRSRSENGLPVPAVLNLARDRWRSGRRTAGRSGAAAHPGPKEIASDSLAPRRHLPVRPPPARRRSGAPVPGAGADRRGKRAGRRRPRRGAPDRRLAAAAGRNRDRARHRCRRTRRRSTPLTG